MKTKDTIDPDDYDDYDDFMSDCTDLMDEDSCQIIWDDKGMKKDQQEVVHKVRLVAKAADAGGMEFILSDATPDRYDDIIEIDGWILDHFKNNPIALFGHGSSFPIGNWVNVRVENGALRGTLKMAPAGTSERIDELRKLIEAGVLKAVSVGFIPLESVQRDDTRYGYRYIKQELIECSLVSVPANPNALAVAKGLKVSRETLEEVFAENGSETTIVRRGAPNGKNAKHRSSTVTPQKGKFMGPLAKRIEDSQTRLVSMRAQLEQHLSTIDDENPDPGATTITEELSDRIERQEKSLAALSAAEQRIANTAAGSNSGVTTLARAPAAGAAAPATPGADRGEVVTLRGPKPFAQAAVGKKPQGADFIFRALAVAIKQQSAANKNSTVLDVLKESYGEDEMTRTIMAKMITKAAAIPADTTTSGWADSLVQTVIGDFIASLMPMSVYPALAAKGGSFTFGRNGVISLPARNTTAAVGGAFIAQGAPIPVKQGAFTPITLTPKKMGVITTMTREITEHSTPSIEAIIRQAILEDTGVAIDTVLLDATAASTIRPAGLKNGVSKTSPTGAGGLTALVGDIKALVAALVGSLKGNLRAPVWIINPGDVLAISLAQTTTGDMPFREEVSRGTLLGIPIIQSVTGLSDMMLLVDAADFITAAGETPQFSVSDQAVLHMEDTTPLAIGTAGTPPTVAAPVRSLWQTDSMAIRMILDINWAMRRTGAVAWTDTMTWN